MLDTVTNEFAGPLAAMAEATCVAVEVITPPESVAGVTTMSLPLTAT